MSEIKKTLTFTVLSISLLTVMAGAAIAPALGTIREHFAGNPDIVVQMIVSMPALFIIMTNLVFTKLCALMETRAQAKCQYQAEYVVLKVTHCRRKGSK